MSVGINAEIKNILLVGVGGQGTILASKLLTSGLTDAGYDVKMSEIHGMSQRGGSVSSQIRYGKEVWSPVIEKGGADILVAFEKMEALRWLEYLKPEGLVVVNNFQINPMPVVSGVAVYAPDILDEIRKAAKTLVVDATEEANKLGNTRVMNMILLGVIVSSVGLVDVDWRKIIESAVKPAFVDLNCKALEIGKALV